LKKYPNLDSYSCGDLLRAKAKEDTEQGRSLAKDMSEGKLVSSETTVGLMEEYMNKSSKTIFLADGFPRN
jgi:adenylate kinase family enzyme